jgi:hypothetical protein
MCIRLFGSDGVAGLGSRNAAPQIGQTFRRRIDYRPRLITDMGNQDK